MDNMHFEEEIQDKEYFEEKISKLEEKIKLLEDKLLAYEKWINSSVTFFNPLDYS